jgi:ATP-binding cassette, subfamily B, bacterial MsbA
LNDVPPREPHAQLDARRTYLRLLTYLRPHRGIFALGMLGGIVFSISMVSFVPFAQLFGDSAFTHRDPRMILFVPLALIGLFVLRGVGDFTETYCMGYVGRRIVTKLRTQIVQRVLRLPIGYFDRNSSAVLLSRLTYNTEQVGQATTDSVAVLIRESLTLLGLLGYLFYLNLQLTLFALVLGPVVGWLVTSINKRFRRYSRRIQDSMGDVTRVSKEIFDAPRLIKVYNAQEHLAGQFETVNEHNWRSNMRLILMKGLANPIVQLMTAIGVSPVIAYAISNAVHGQMTTGELLGFLTALGMLAQPLRNLIGVSGPMQQGIAGAQSLFEMIDEPAEPQGGSRVVGRARGEVEFDNVSFTYDSGKGAALSGVTLKVAPGENIAIVGRSGSGKSTLVNLLPRFYDVKAGEVRIDGVDVRDYQLRSLREQIAVVSQDVVLFNDTIRNNIAFGRDVSPEAIEAAAEAAHVLEFAREQPAGLDTMVGDRGVLLSGGQRQRIAIARALLKNAPILILDEATSALDTEAERHIQAALAQLVRNRTTFVIAHRLSTVEEADRIVVLDSGSIAESGTHAELLAHGGLYSQLHRLQFND